MKTALVLILNLIGLSISLPLNSVDLQRDVIARNTGLEQIILDLLDDLRDLMLTGSDSIPVLDPLTIENLDLDFNDIGLPGTLKVDNAVVRHLSTFDVDLTFRTIILRHTLVFDGYIPSIDIEASNYDLDINVEGITLFGNGRASLSFIEPRLIGDLELATVIGIVTGTILEIRECEIQFKLGGFKSDIRGLLGDEAASDFINSFLAYLIPDLILFYENDITTFLSETVKTVGNEILKDIQVGGIIN